MRESSIKGEPLAMSTDESGTPTVSSAPVQYTRTPSEEEELNNNVKSAFEIISVTDTDDMESSMRQPGHSADEQQIKANLSSSNRKDSVSEEETASLSENQKVTLATSAIPEDEGEPSTPPTARQAEMKPAQSSLVALQMQQPVSGIIGVNGPSGVSRFRRVNNYVRARWIVRDTSGPEERPESDVKGGPLLPQNLRTEHGGSPLLPRRELSDPLPSSDLEFSASHLLSLPAGSDTGSDKDATSTVMETLSRNTSLSSIPTEKSLDLDVAHIRDLENDPVPGPTTSLATVVPSTTGPTTIVPSTAGSATVVASTAGSATVVASTAVSTTVVPSTTSLATVVSSTAGPTTVVASTAGSATVVPSTSGSTTVVPNTVPPATVSTAANPSVSDVTYTTLSASMDLLKETMSALGTTGSDVTTTTTHGPTCSCETCAAGVEVKGEGQQRSKRVKTYLTNLQEEMNQLLESSANLESLKKENDQLHEENDRLKQKNESLRQEVERLTAIHEENEKLRQMNSSLKLEVERLTDRTRFVDNAS